MVLKPVKRPEVRPCVDSVRPKRLKKRQTGRVGAVEAEFFNGLLDIVLVIEALDSHFVNRFWEFIKAGGYEIKQRGVTGRSSTDSRIPPTKPTR